MEHTNLGTYLVGRVVGIKERTYTDKTNQLRTAYSLGLAVGGYEDQWGQVSEQVQGVDLSTDVVGAVQKMLPDIRDKVVQVKVVFRARKGGRDGAFLTCFMPQDQMPRLLGANNKLAAA